MDQQTPARQFAVEVVTQLRKAGYEALWAGGCVRDFLLGKEPKDYDVATNAKPDQILAVFKHRRCLPMGAAFGVIAVLGPTKSAGQIEIATFREDLGYSDGRHPDAVKFSTAEADAQRRDFTINGLFFDPVAEEVVDYVHGKEDLAIGLIRAIGDPYARFEEDKLRMLRAVRFAATFGFEIEPATWNAMIEQAEEIRVVSAERITGELKRIITGPSRRRGLELLLNSRLLQQIIGDPAILEFERLSLSLAALAVGPEPTFSAAVATLLKPSSETIDENELKNWVHSRLKSWKLSNEELSAIVYCLAGYRRIREGESGYWPRLQPFLADSRVAILLRFAENWAKLDGIVDSDLAYSQARANWPSERLNPVPLLNGNELIRRGYKPSPHFQKVLTTVWERQLLEEIRSPEEALEMGVKLLDALASSN